ncbi:hypothetical protein CI102_13933 [Trichoderma harzianum]|nr:hypothetical protein CI102_13933 [Trichoderma harzianum]
MSFSSYISSQSTQTVARTPTRSIMEPGENNEHRRQKKSKPSSQNRTPRPSQGSNPKRRPSHFDDDLGQPSHGSNPKRRPGHFDDDLGQPPHGNNPERRLSHSVATDLFNAMLPTQFRISDSLINDGQSINQTQEQSAQPRPSSNAQMFGDESNIDPGLNNEAVVETQSEDEDSDDDLEEIPAPVTNHNRRKRSAPDPTTEDVIPIPHVKRKSRKEMSDWNEDLEKTFKQFEVSCRVGMLCRLNRDFEEDAINFHFQHIKGTDRQYVLQDARQKCANNINTWRCRAMDKHEDYLKELRKRSTLLDGEKDVVRVQAHLAEQYTLDTFITVFQFVSSKVDFKKSSKKVLRWCKMIFCYMGAQIKLAQDVERGKLDDPNDDYTRAAIQEKLRLFSREE